MGKVDNRTEPDGKGLFIMTRSARDKPRLRHASRRRRVGTVWLSIGLVEPRVTLNQLQQHGQIPTVPS
jgi:hypothetical protein